jgi:methionine synthase I (cobalamin-dependent)
MISELISRGPVITDGAWGTQLQIKGLKSGECPDYWNVIHPELVGEVAKSYVDAGSHVILTNTFGANRIRLEAHGLKNKVREINMTGVAISREAAGGNAKVFASMGPTGKLIMNGDISPKDMEEVFNEQAEALALAGIDAIIVETMTDLEEAVIAIKAARSTGLPVVASMVFDSGMDMDRTMMGLTPEQVVEGLEKAGVDVLGANCGQYVAGYIPICKRMKAVSKLPIWIKANAGIPDVSSNGTVEYKANPDAFASNVTELVACGANFVGGCCGTSPEFIKAIHKNLTYSGFFSCGT